MEDIFQELIASNFDYLVKKISPKIIHPPPLLMIEEIEV